MNSNLTADTNPATFRTSRLRAVRRLSAAFAVAALAGLGASVAHAGNILWSNSGGSAWLTGTNWTGGATPGATDVAQFGANPTSATGLGISMSGATNNGTANQAVGAIEVTSARSSAGVTLGDSSTTTAGTLTLNGATVNSVSDVILRNNSSATLTLQPGQTGTAGAQSMSVALGDATANVVNVDSTGNIVVSSNITGAGKSLTVNAASTGDLRLSGTNSYDGGTTITGGSGGGRLRVDALAALPTTGTVAVSTGGRLTLNVAGPVTYGGISQALTFNPNQTANPSLDILSGAAVTWQGTVAINAETRIEANGAAGSLTFSGNASGSGTLIKQAAGNLILSGTGNSLTGGTQIGNGTLTVNSGSSMGTGALALFQTSTNNTALTLNNAAQSVGSLSSQFTATTGTQTQTITLNGTALTVNQSADGTYGTGAVSTLTSTITGTGSLNKSGSAKLTLSSANTYTGATTVSAGTLAVTGSANSTSAIQMNTGGTLLMSSSTGASNIVGTGTVAPTANTQTFTGSVGSTAVTLGTGGGGGTLAVATGQSGTTHSFASLALGANSILDFGSGNTGVNMVFGGSPTLNGNTLTINNWSGPDYSSQFGSLTPADIGTFWGTQDRLLFTTDPSNGHLGMALTGISFNGTAPGMAVSFGSYYEIVPVPEPTTVLGAAGLLGFVGYRERKRVRGVWVGHIVPALSFLGSLVSRAWRRETKRPTPTA